MVVFNDIKERNAKNSAAHDVICDASHEYYTKQSQGSMYDF